MIELINSFQFYVKYSFMFGQLDRIFYHNPLDDMIQFHRSVFMIKQLIILFASYVHYFAFNFFLEEFRLLMDMGLSRYKLRKRRLAKAAAEGFTLGENLFLVLWFIWSSSAFS